MDIIDTEGQDEVIDNNYSEMMEFLEEHGLSCVRVTGTEADLEKVEEDDMDDDRVHYCTLCDFLPSGLDGMFICDTSSDPEKV